MKQFLSTISVGLAILLGTSACAVTSHQSTVGEYVDDSAITARVKTRFAEDEKVSAMRISVETLKGVVTLSGFAISEEEKSRAGEVARGVPNVKSVVNGIVVRKPTK